MQFQAQRDFHLLALLMCNDVIGRKVGRDGDEQVSVVGHDFQSRHVAVQFGALLAYQRLAARRHIPDKALAAALGTEDDVQVQIVDAVA